jgi:hypothetical protein
MANDLGSMIMEASSSIGTVFPVVKEFLPSIEIANAATAALWKYSKTNFDTFVSAKTLNMAIWNLNIE